MLTAWIENTFLMLLAAIAWPAVGELCAAGAVWPACDTRVPEFWKAALRGNWGGAVRTLQAETPGRRLSQPMGGLCSFTKGVRAFPR